MASVALITSSFLPRFGGVEEHVLNVATRLRERGHDAMVWSVDQGDESVPDQVDGVPLRYLPCPLPARSRAAALDAARNVPRAWSAWWDAYHEDKPNILHVQCYGPNGVYASALARLVRRPLIVSSHGETMADANGAFQRSRLLRASLRSALRQASAVTAVSNFVVRDLEHTFGLSREKVRIVPNGVDLAEPTGRAPSWLPQRYVLAVGRLVRNKGFDLLIEAFAQLPDTGLALVIGGDGPERSSLQQLAHCLGVGDRVLLPGQLNRPEVTATMARAVTVVMPSRIEAFGIVVLEAWRAGTPIIATALGGPPEFVDDGATGILVDPRDGVALTAAIARMAEDLPTAQRIGTAGRQRVDEFSWDNTVDLYESLYAGL